MLMFIYGICLERIHTANLQAPPKARSGRLTLKSVPAMQMILSARFFHVFQTPGFMDL